MNDETWAGLGEKVEPDWAPERKWAVRAAIARRAARRRVVVRSALATASAGTIVVAGLVLVSWRSVVAPSIAPSAAPSADLHTASRASAEIAGGDGSGKEEQKTATETVIVTQLSPDTQLAPLPNRDGRGFALRAGAARFAVPHDSNRPFVVTAGDVLIEDLGTTFTVRYVGADQLNIAVEEGRVRVRGGDTDTEVSAGSTLQVPVSRAALSRAGKVAHRSLRSSGASGAVASAWRPLAEGGQYDEAQRMLRKAGPSAVRDDTADLLLAADAARLSGHPAEAVPYLERVLHGHAADPRAGLAAFT
ncbi:MAG TPA: FecR family protein, partial [Polyangia bacterium]